MRVARVLLASHPGGDVVVDVPVSAMRRHFPGAAPCEACDGVGHFGEGDDWTRCEACGCTGVQRAEGW